MDDSGRRSRSIAVAECVYKTLLVAYPKDFRQNYGAEMVQLFRALCQGEIERGGRRGLLGLSLRTFLELVGTAIGERTRKGSSVFSAAVFSSRNITRLGGFAAISGGVLLVAVWVFAITANPDLTGGGSNLERTIWFARIGLVLLFIVALLILYLRITKESENARRARLLATAGLVSLLVVVATFFLDPLRIGFLSIVLQGWALVIATGIMVVSGISAGVLGRRAIFSLFLISLWVPPQEQLVRSLGVFIHSSAIRPIYLALSPQVRNQTGLPNPILAEIELFLTNMLYFALPSVLAGIGWILLGRMIRNASSLSRGNSNTGLEELQQLHAAGVLTDDEFSNAKLRLSNQ